MQKAQQKRKANGTKEMHHSAVSATKVRQVFQKNPYFASDGKSLDQIGIGLGHDAGSICCSAFLPSFFGWHSYHPLSGLGFDIHLFGLLRMRAIAFATIADFNRYWISQNDPGNLYCNFDQRRCVFLFHNDFRYQLMVEGCYYRYEKPMYTAVLQADDMPCNLIVLDDPTSNFLFV